MKTRNGLLGIVVLAFLVVGAYSPAFHAGYLWDDSDYVVENANLVRPDGWHRIWFAPRQMVQYYPLVHSVLRAEHSLWQLRPTGYHVVNVLLQALNAILLWMLLRRLAVPGSWFIAAVFGVHPLQVESVAWITEIKNLLSGCFYFLSVLAYWRFRAAPPAAPRTGARKRSRSGDGDGDGDGRGRRRFTYGLAAAAFLLALLSKTTAVTMPAALAVLIWWKSPRFERRELLPLVPLFGLAGLLGALTWWLETFHVGSENVLVLSIWDRLLIPARAAWFYAAKLVWPADLCFIYPRWTADPRVWWQYLFPLGAAAVLAVLWAQRGRWGKGPLAAVLFYLLTLLPASGVVRFYFQLYSFVGDHFQYLAGIGLVSAGVAPVAGWLGARQSSPAARAAARLVPALILGVLVVLTWNRTRVYGTEEGVWRDTIAKNPAAWIAHNNLGVACKRLGRKDEAAAHFETAVQYQPNSPEAHANLALLYQEKGDTGRAIDEYRKALELKPQLADMQYNLGVLLLQHGRLDEAAQRFSAVLASRPRMAEAHRMLGDVFVARHELEKAAPEYRAALAIDPSLANAHSRLGWVLTNLGSYAEARPVLVEAVRLDSRDAHAQALLGFVLEKLGDTAGALRQYERALQLSPQLDLATQGLARLASPAH